LNRQDFRRSILSRMWLPISPSGLMFSRVPAARLELARFLKQEILSLRCLPFHHAGIGAGDISLSGEGYGLTLLDNRGRGAESHEPEQSMMKNPVGDEH
jgi:hypothetical protein